MKILIGMDDSPHAREALNFVMRKLQLPATTNVIVASVAQELVPAYTEVYTGAPFYSEEMSHGVLERHQEIASEAERQLRDAGFHTEARVVHGDPRSVLVDLARLENVDLLVVGSHGRTGISKLLMGSVAAFLIAHAPCTVMVVKLH